MVELGKIANIKIGIAPTDVGEKFFFVQFPIPYTLEVQNLPTSSLFNYVRVRHPFKLDVPLAHSCMVVGYLM